MIKARERLANIKGRMCKCGKCGIIFEENLESGITVEKGLCGDCADKQKLQDATKKKRAKRRK